MHADREMRSIFPASRAHEVRERRERSEHEAAPKVARLSLADRETRMRHPASKRLRLPRA